MDNKYISIDKTRKKLSKDFLFGAATSAYQIEGGWMDDGKGPSIWDMKSITGEIQNQHTGHIACDHYHRWREDIRFMKNLGLQAYRFSIAWSRIYPTFSNKPNRKGIEFYQALVKELIRQGIEPFVTLYHWDLPLWLDELGGWANPKTVTQFVRYAKTMYKALPEVKYWITLNEPAVFINNCWGFPRTEKDQAKAIKNVLLAHGKTAQAIDKKVGISLNLMPVFPNELNNPKDDLAAYNVHTRHNCTWLNPIYKGEFPEGIDELWGFDEGALKFTNKQSEIVSTPIDFLGVNYYTAITVKYNYVNYPTYAKQILDRRAWKDEMGIESHPNGIYHLLKQVNKEYGNKDYYITENGCACPDIFTHNTNIHDEERINYIQKHLEAIAYTREQGIKIKGYFYWSLLDNFEWMFGYNKKFGLIYIFLPTQSRIPKDSYYWYRHFITGKPFSDCYV